MRIKYVGDRGSIGTTCMKGSRGEYYFGPENNFTCEVTPEHAQELLKSMLHRFEIVTEEKIEKPVVETIVLKPKKEKIRIIEKEEPKKKGRPHGKK